MALNRPKAARTVGLALVEVRPAALGLVLQQREPLRVRPLAEAGDLPHDGLQQLGQRRLVRRQPRRSLAAEDALPAAPRRREAVADRQTPGLA